MLGKADWLASMGKHHLFFCKEETATMTTFPMRPQAHHAGTNVPGNVVPQASWPLAGDRVPLATWALCWTPDWPCDSKQHCSPGAASKDRSPPSQDDKRRISRKLSGSKPKGAVSSPGCWLGRTVRAPTSHAPRTASASHVASSPHRTHRCFICKSWKLHHLVSAEFHMSNHDRATG